MTHRLNLKFGFGSLLFACLMTQPVIAQTPGSANGYPNKPIRLVVPFAAGGGNDFLARDLAQHLQGQLGQALVVENRAGAGGIIGSDIVARAPADGYTLLMAANSATIVDATTKAPPFRLARDLAGVGMVADIPLVLVVSNDVKAHNVKELVELLKRDPGKLNYATAGPGTIMHVATELFASMTGTQMTHIPFKGAAQMVPELLAGRVQVLFGAANSLIPFLKSGQLRALAVGGAQRWPGMPEIPTVAESGVPGYAVDIWYGLLAPKSTPRPIVDKLNATMNAYLAQPTTAARYAEQGMTPRPGTPAQFDALIAGDVARWTDVAKRIGFSQD